MLQRDGSERIAMSGARAETRQGEDDVLIAAQGLRIGATLVTANVSEFAREAGLVREDWTRQP
jgi:tRNA(fMet)-specific endonuclease VapC